MSDSQPSLVVDLLRHGEPVGGRRYRGQFDDPLSDKGWAQMRAAVQPDDHWDVVYSSPLVRCAAFAAEISTTLRLPLKLEDRFKEIGFGEWEGKSADQLHQRDPGCIERFWADPVGNRPAGAEPLDRFAARISDGWRDLVDASAGRRVLVVGHAGMIRMVLAIVLGLPPENMFRIQVDNAGRTRIRFRNGDRTSIPILAYHGRVPVYRTA